MRFLKMTGRCATGAELDKGVRFHAVPAGHPWTKAACGAEPGARGNGWSVYVGDAVTCPRCIAKLAKQASAQAVAKTETMMKITAKRYTADVYRLMEDGKVVGFAMRLTNGKWCMSDTDDRRMDSIQYGSPNEVAKCFQTMRLLTTP